MHPVVGVVEGAGIVGVILTKILLAVVELMTMTMHELPKITWKGKTYTYDYRLSEFRQITPNGFRFIKLNTQENELLNFAIENKSIELLSANMHELSYKL